MCIISTSTYSHYVAVVNCNLRVLCGCQVCNCQCIKVCYTEILGMSMNYHHTKFHMPSSSVSLVIAFKWKSKYRSCVATVLYILQINYRIRRCASFERSLHIILGPHIKWHQYPTSEVHLAVKLILLMTGI
jgi:hypothetical protein